MYAAKKAEAAELSREATKKYTGTKDDKDIQKEVFDLVQNADVEDYYEKGAILGEGAYGQVWVGTRYEDSEDGSMKEGDQFAIKTIFDSDSEAQLGREVKVMLCANHPNLVKMHEVYQMKGGDSKLHLVMDLVKPDPKLAQSDLFEWIMEFGALSMENTCKLIYQSADSLKYLNDAENCIHRDLKPENILIGPERFDRIRVTDYGLARIFPDGIKGKEALAATANVGSNGYQAPETINEYGDKTMYGKQCDMFSLGVIAYICCSQSPPFGLGPSARLHDIKSGNFKPMSGDKWSKVPDEMQELIRGMLKVNPDERLTAQDILDHPWVKAQASTDKAQA